MSLSTFEFQELEQQRYPQESCPYASRHRHRCTHCGFDDGTQLPDSSSPVRARRPARITQPDRPAWWPQSVDSPGGPSVDWGPWESRPTPEGPQGLTRTLGSFRLWIRVNRGRPYWSVETLSGDPICWHGQYPLVTTREDAANAAVAAATYFAAEFAKGDDDGE